MPTDQVRVRSLYAGLNLTIIWFGLLVAAAWLFAIFSYYLSSKAGTDWFARSGSVMCLVGAVNTMEGTWTGLRNYLRPFRGVSKWYLAGYVAIFEWSNNIKRVTDGFLRLLLGVPCSTDPGS